jgi:hypothetical protein
VSPRQHRPDDQNPIAGEASQTNAAQAWLQYAVHQRISTEALNTVTIICCAIGAIASARQQNIHDIAAGTTNREA